MENNNLRASIEQIQSRLDIVEVISGYIPLKKAGVNFKALCPFHPEKTPSFVVNPNKQIYHCFGCGAGGDAISFVMAHEKMDFVEALKILADKTGVKLPLFKGADYAKRSSIAPLLYRVNEMAVSYYNAILIGSDSARAAREYLRSRGISAQTVSAFKLGFAQDLWDGLLKYAQKNKINADALLKAGLIIPGKEGTYYDRFRNRIIFPICDAGSKVVGFGARVLDDSLPKYINSPETDIYIKGRHLYGLNVAASEIRRQNEIIIVEGYLDSIIPFQYGIGNIVATLGTALTGEQITLIKRYTSNAVIIFDSDEAGEAASLRSLDLLIAEGLNVKIASLPKGLDPDTYVRKNQAESFKGLVKSAKGLFDYKMDILLSRHGKNTTEAKAAVISEMLPTIKRMGNAVLKSDYIKKLSHILAIDEKAILTELDKVRLDYARPVPATAFKPKQQSGRAAEKVIVALMMEDAETAHRIKNEFTIEDFKDPRIRKITECLFAIMEENKQPTPARIMHHISDEEQTQFVCALLSEAENIVDKEKTLQDCIKWIKVDNLRVKKEELAHQIKEAEKAGKDKEVMELVREFNNLSLPSPALGRHGRQGV